MSEFSHYFLIRYVNIWPVKMLSS